MADTASCGVGESKPRVRCRCGSRCTYDGYWITCAENCGSGSWHHGSYPRWKIWLRVWRERLVFDRV